jgi:hypothetical protein
MNNNTTTIGAARSRGRRRFKTAVVSATVCAALVSSVAFAARQDGTRVDPPVEPRRSNPEIADWARANGLSGLSPAGLSPTRLSTHDAERSRAGELAAIAEWAKANGLTGLSPASVHTIEE